LIPIGDKTLSTFNSKILVIRPSFSNNHGSAIAIINKDTRQLDACGLLVVDVPQNTISMANKARQFWDEQIGANHEPKILCIEYPDRCFVGNDYMENFKSIFMLGILCLRIETKFSTPNIVRPSPNKWKGNKDKDATEMLVRDKLCVLSKKVLQKNLSTIQKHLHHNVYDAVGLGLWVIENSEENTKVNYLS
jgi:hypothetical protein